MIEELGSGAYASVYKAVQEPLGRTVAVKALRATVSLTSPFAAHLEREARILGELSHPNVVELIDFGKTAEDLYLVLEYLDGRSVADLLSRKKNLGVDAAVAVGIEIARGLSYVHERGFVHRDVKPGNVLLSRAGDVKLVDFGIALREGSREVGDAEPMSGEAGFGSPAYMSPEQVLGEVVDARSDLFSLGVVMFEMISGVRPFNRGPGGDGTSPEHPVRDHAPKLRSLRDDVPHEVERLVMALLERLPSDRVESAAAVADELAEVARARGRASQRAIAASLLREGAAKLATPRPIRVDVPGALARPMTQVVFGFGVLLLAALAGGALIERNASELASPFFGGKAPEIPPEGTETPGFLSVLATPWADVYVDGKHTETTPFATPIRVSPGTHYVTLTHPEAEPESRVIHIAAGERLNLEVNMTLRAQISPAAAATAAADGRGSEGGVQRQASAP